MIQPQLLAGISLIAVTAFITSASAQPDTKSIPSSGPSDARLASFDKMMTDFLEAHPEIPGATIAVARDGRIVYNRGFGQADGKMAMQPASKLRVASISKPITAVAILQLIERGKLKFDSKVFDILDLEEPKKGTFDPRWRQVTIQQLLQHTGGWDRAMSFDPMFHNKAICAELKVHSPALQEEIIRYMLGVPLAFNPGERYAYSNFGYCLLGRVIEKISGRRYEAHVRAAVLDPLGMSETRLGMTLHENRWFGEVSYECGGKKGTAILGPDLGKPVPLPYGAWALEAMDSHGGWVSTGADLVRFGAAFDHPEQCKVLTAKSIATMFARPPGAAGEGKSGKEKGTYYGCGWSVRPTGTSANTWHTGQLPGTSTILVRRGKDRLTWAVLFNGSVPGKTAPATIIDPLVHVAADAVKEWP